MSYVCHLKLVISRASRRSVIPLFLLIPKSIQGHHRWTSNEEHVTLLLDREKVHYKSDSTFVRYVSNELGKIRLWEKAVVTHATFKKFTQIYIGVPGRGKIRIILKNTCTYLCSLNVRPISLSLTIYISDRYILLYHATIIAHPHKFVVYDIIISCIK